MRPWFALLALACQDEKGSGDSAADGDADADTDSELPYVIGADAACSYHTTGTSYWQWTLNASADDPQGVKTVDSFGNVDVLDAKEKVAASYTLGCSPKGMCATSFKADDDGILCKAPEEWTFRFTVLDEDKNVSVPFEVNGHLAGD